MGEIVRSFLEKQTNSQFDCAKSATLIPTEVPVFRMMEKNSCFGIKPPVLNSLLERAQVRIDNLTDNRMYLNKIIYSVFVLFAALTSSPVVSKSRFFFFLTTIRGLADAAADAKTSSEIVGSPKPI